MFCRHNRLEANCPICQREKAPAPRERAAPRTRTATASRRGTGVVTRKLVRATDDGYRFTEAPGLKATTDAERLADALTIAAARLEFPGPVPEVAERDTDAAAELAFLLALAGPDATERREAVLAGDETGIDAFRVYRERGAWHAGDTALTPQRRFARTFDSLRLPGFTRAPKFEFLVTLAAAGIYDLVPASLFVDVKANDPTTLAAKRLLNSGDAMLLERRAAALAEALDVPLAALDRGLVLWDAPGPLPAAEHSPVRAALGV